MTDRPGPETFRKRVTRPCEICGRMMVDVLAKRLTCSDACRSKRNYWRKRALTDPTAPFRVELNRKGWLRTDPD